MLKAFLEQPLWIRILRGLLLASILAGICIAVPTPYRVMAPGIARPVGPMVKIQRQTYKSSGEFLLPTVVSEEASLLYCIYALLDPQANLTREDTSVPHAQSPAGGRQMALSQLISVQVALGATGHITEPEILGLRVVAVDARSPNAGILKPGDLLLEVDGVYPKSIRMLKQALADKKPGDQFFGRVKRGEEESDLELGVYQPGSRPLLGVNLRIESKGLSFPFDVSIDSGSTVGASGGLVFALEIYDQLTEADLTQGQVVAATGTLDPDGSVGPIEGVEFKIQGARRAGATIFLCPKSNVNDLHYVPKGIEVIPVSNFNEALDALKK